MPIGKMFSSKYIHVPLSMLKKKENLELLMNAEPFMVSENGEVVFWDVRYPKAGEYPIYLVHFPVGIYFAGYHFRGVYHSPYLRRDLQIYLEIS